jgi:uncharacterized membrane protein
MNNILRRVFHVVSAVSYVWLTLIFVSLSMLATQAGAPDCAHAFQVGVFATLFMFLMSLFAGCRIFWKESLFITKANTVFFSVATIVYSWLLIDAGTTGFDWPLVVTIAVAVFGAFTLSRPVVPKA